MIKPNNLENREGVGEGADPKAERPAVPSPRSRDAEASPGSETKERQALLIRIAAARKLQPQGAERHCADCWTKGRDAAIRAILGGEP